MENNSLFNIPSQLHTKIKQRSYKSPESSPVITTERHYRTKSNETLDLQFSSRKKAESDSVDLTERNLHKAYLFKNMQHQQEKVNNMKALLKNFQNSKQDWSIDSEIKAKILENRMLAETIKNLSLSKEIELHESTEYLLKNIQEHDIEIADLEKNLNEIATVKVKNKSDCIVYKADVQRLISENQEIKQEIELKNKVLSKYKKTCKISHAELGEIQKKVARIGERCEAVRRENIGMKGELRRIKSDNYVRVYGTTYENISQLSNILGDLMKISALATEYSGNSESQEFNKILQQDYAVNCNSVKEYLDSVKREVTKLRLRCTDVYAEKCGSKCTPQ